MVHDQPVSAPGNAATAPELGGEHHAARVLGHELERDRLSSWKSLPEARPDLRGFMAPILRRSDHVPFHFNTSNATTQQIRAQELVATNLATKGLLPTLVQVVEALNPSTFLQNTDSNALLQSVGFPQDLLRHFDLPPSVAERDIVRHVANELNSGHADALQATLAATSFRFKATAPGFEAALESGEHEIDLLRAQLTRGDHWLHEQDGGNLHLLRQMMEQLPTTSVIASVQSAYLGDLRDSLGHWPNQVVSRITIISEPLPVAQWAQDNGKAGSLNHKPATLAPRYASRGDDGSTFIAGENLLLEGVSESGHGVLHSPLLFQGGNLLVVSDPRNGSRLLLIGEAEIHRNTALGLTREKVIEAFRVETAVERVELLPAVSFHIDYDVTIRRVGPRSVAFVNDTFAAVDIVLRCALETMQQHKFISAAEGHGLLTLLAQDRDLEFLNQFTAVMRAHSDANGRYSNSVAEKFSTGPADSGVGNLHRIMLALDLLMMRATGDRAISDRNLLAYLEAWRALEEDRGELHRRLKELGFEIVAVPGIADAGRSISCINGLHDPKGYFMPAYGGLFAPLDDAARKIFANALGPQTEVVPILCSESQRRSGAVHCSLSAFPERP